MIYTTDCFQCLMSERFSGERLSFPELSPPLLSLRKSISGWAAPQPPETHTHTIWASKQHADWLQMERGLLCVWHRRWASGGAEWWDFCSFETGLGQKRCSSTPPLSPVFTCSGTVASSFDDRSETRCRRGTGSEFIPGPESWSARLVWPPHQPCKHGPPGKSKNLRMHKKAVMDN